MNGQELAGFGRRIVATGIDVVVVPLLAVIIMLVTGTLEHAEDYVGYRPVVTAILLGAASYLILNGWLLWKYGQTLGKKLLGIAIVMDVDNSKPSIVRLLLVRGLFFPLLYLIVVPWMLLLLLPIVDQAFIFRKDRRCLHDLVAGTRIVRAA